MRREKAAGSFCRISKHCIKGVIDMDEKNPGNYGIFFPAGGLMDLTSATCLRANADIGLGIMPRNYFKNLLVDALSI